MVCERLLQLYVSQSRGCCPALEKVRIDAPKSIEIGSAALETCKYVLNTQTVLGPSGKTHKITSTFTCVNRNLIYAIICQMKCGHIYIGETKTTLSIRFSDHLGSIRDNLSG